MVEALEKAFPEIVLATDISAIKDEWKMYMTEKDSKLLAFISDTGTFHYWRSVYEIKTVSESSMLSHHHWVKHSWHSKIAIVQLKSPFQKLLLQLCYIRKG